MWRKAEMMPTVRRRTDDLGFETGPKTLSYKYAVSLNRMDVDEQPYGCREFIFNNGEFHSYRIGRAGNFYEIASGKPGDPIPTVEVTDIECP